MTEDLPFRAMLLK